MPAFLDSNMTALCVMYSLRSIDNYDVLKSNCYICVLYGFLLARYIEMEYAPLHAAGFLDISYDQLESFFVSPFDNKSRRAYLLSRFGALKDRFKETGLIAEVWIDGSFSTMKPEPGDIDVIFWVDGSQLNLLPAEKQNIISELNNRNYSNIRYNCDVFIIPNQNVNNRSYWRGWFGYSRDEVPKGIIRLYI